MARLTITVDIDVDATLEDPHDVAQFLLDWPASMSERNNYHGSEPEFIDAEWAQ